MKTPIDKTMAEANEALRSFVPATDFVGYPFGAGEPFHFRAGVASPPVPAFYIESLAAKKAGKDQS